jgi:hypothetical protein
MQNGVCVCCVCCVVVSVGHLWRARLLWFLFERFYIKNSCQELLESLALHYYYAAMCVCVCVCACACVRVCVCIHLCYLFLVYTSHWYIRLFFTLNISLCFHYKLCILEQFYVKVLNVIFPKCKKYTQKQL